MRIFHGVKKWLEDSQGKSSAEPRVSVMTIGNFDGIHLGHQKLIQHLLQKAKAVGSGPKVVMTFLMSFMKYQKVQNYIKQNTNKTIKKRNI